MTQVLDPVDTYLMISGKDQNVATKLVFDMEYQVWLNKLYTKKKKKNKKPASK